MLFYTGANKNQAIQQNSSMSLGGWISSSQVPNDVLNNLFSSIDYTAVKNNLKSNRVIAFKNLSGAEIASFKVWTNTAEDSFAKFKIGIILNAIDTSCNIPYFELLSSDQASPFYVSLADCEGEVNALTLANVPANQYVGIFIQRELIPDNNVDFNSAGKTCDQWFQEFSTPTSEEDQSIKTEDLVEIVISY